jgi:hypothetical protein
MALKRQMHQRSPVDPNRTESSESLYLLLGEPLVSWMGYFLSMVALCFAFLVISQNAIAEMIRSRTNIFMIRVTHNLVIVETTTPLMLRAI